MQAVRKFAEVFPPGEFIREELEERGWSQVELAEILGRTPRLVSEIITGKRAITPDTAKAIGDAFGTSAQYWMNLESAYQLWKAQEADQAIARRARLYQLAPIKEMVKRNWIEPSENVEVLEQRILKFFGLHSLDEEPVYIPHAARKSTPYANITPSQRTWLYRAWHLAHAVSAETFTKSLFANGLTCLQRLMGSVEDIRLVPRTLAEMGIRFLVLEALPQTKIDGVCFWLNAQTPVIVLSLRFDRIDAFWHSLGHELYHVKNGDGLHDLPLIDTDMIRENGDEESQKEKPENEKKASEFATEFLVRSKDLKDFIARTAPLYSMSKIDRFAQRIKIHPGLVVGQLQYRGEISYAQYRKLLEKMRHLVAQSALTDGWGHSLPAILRAIA